MIASASSVSVRVGAPKDSPFDAASWTAETTSGRACPNRAGPQVHTRSRYRVPSASQIHGPWAFSMKRGTPPTDP